LLPQNNDAVLQQRAAYLEEVQRAMLYDDLLEVCTNHIATNIIILH
jgi:hypothetical protein